MHHAPDPHALVGERPDDPGDVVVCASKTYVALGTGMGAYDWESPSRVIPCPREIESGPFTELHLAPSPAAAVAGMVLRRRAGSEQRIVEILGDARRAAVYRVRAPGVRIKDGRLNGRLVAGALGLRREGEQERLEDRALVATGRGGPSDEASESGRSNLWSTVDRGFKEPVAAIELPDDAVHPALKLDLTLIASVRRLEALEATKLFKLEYQGHSCVRWRDLLRMKDLSGRPAGARFLRYLVREGIADFLSLSRRKGLRAWLSFAAAVLAFLSSLGSLGWLLSKLLQP